MLQMFKPLLNLSFQSFIRLSSPTNSASRFSIHPHTLRRHFTPMASNLRLSAFLRRGDFSVNCRRLWCFFYQDLVALCTWTLNLRGLASWKWLEARCLIIEMRRQPRPPHHIHPKMIVVCYWTNYIKPFSHWQFSHVGWLWPEYLWTMTMWVLSY